MVRFIHQPNSSSRTGEIIRNELGGGTWTEFRAAIAFVKFSGVRHISSELGAFAQSHAVRIAVGVDLKGSSREGLQELLSTLKGRGEVWVYHNENGSTFHPKVFLLKNRQRALVVIGSSNLTEGGLFTNYEAGIELQLDLSDVADSSFLREVENALDAWMDPAPGHAVKLDSAFLTKLIANGYVVSEIQSNAAATQRRGRTTGSGTAANLFPATAVQPPPATPRRTSASQRGRSATQKGPIGTPSGAGGRGFLMTLQTTDVGRGQKTAGASARSPEIFIPLAARDFDSAFWGWPTSFTQDPKHPGKYDRSNVRVLYKGAIITINMMTWPVKHDFRIRNAVLRNGGHVGDILKCERSPLGGTHEYEIEIIGPRSPAYARCAAMCTHIVRKPSKKQWGYYS